MFLVKNCSRLKISAKFLYKVFLVENFSINLYSRGLNKKVLDIKSEKKSNKYVPLSKREDRPQAVLWLTRNYPQLSDGQIVKLVGSTKKTVDLIRNKRYWNSSNLTPKDPVVSSLCSQADIKNAVDKADRKAARMKKELERKNKKIESTS